MKLQNKLLAPLLALTLIPLIILGSLAYYYLVVTTRSHYFEEMSNLGTTVTRTIQTRFDNVRANLLLFSGSHLLRQYMVSGEERYALFQPSLIRQLSEYQKVFPEYYEIRVLLLNGEEDTRVVNRQIRNLSTDESGSELFETLMAQKDEATISLVTINGDTGEISAYFALPMRVRDPNKPLTAGPPPLRGFLVLTMDTGFIQELTETVRIGEHGFVVVTHLGRAVYKPPQIDWVPNFHTSVYKRNDDTYSVLTATDQDYVVTHQTLMNGLNLHMLIPVSDLNLAANRVATWMVLLILGVVLVISLLVYQQARKLFLLPIYRLRQVVTEIGEGNLHTRENFDELYSSSDDEFGDLYRSISKMRHNLDKSQQQIRQLAYYDELTGLPNRVALRRELDALIGSGQRNHEYFAVVFLDIDNFKSINDTLGHDLGDLLLREVSTRIQENLRISDFIVRSRAETEGSFHTAPNIDSTAGNEPSAHYQNKEPSAQNKEPSAHHQNKEPSAHHQIKEPSAHHQIKEPSAHHQIKEPSAQNKEPPWGIVARQGGDEFTLLLNRINHPSVVSNVAQRILKALSRPYMVGQHETFVGASMGIAIYPQDGTTAEELLRHADLAMYEAKKGGKNNFEFFSRDMNAMAFQRMVMETHLRKALELEEFSLHYQPRIAMSDESLNGFEALIRWRNPTMGLVSPNQFIPLAEESILICEIGNWVMDSACKQIKTWIGRGYTDICVSVNLSPMQISRGETFNMIRAMIHTHQIPGHNLEIEITESGLLKDEKIALEFLGKVKTLGVRVALDDFGTGYSSLSYLRRLPIDVLKIDRSFVVDVETDADTASVLESIIHLANKLSLKTVAEGIESQSQLDFVKRAGCTFVQGYYYAKPMNIDDAERYLQAKRAPVV